MVDKKVFFVGGGTMAEGIIKALIRDGIIQAEKISVFDIVGSRMEHLKKHTELITMRMYHRVLSLQKLLLLRLNLRTNPVYLALCQGSQSSFL